MPTDNLATSAYTVKSSIVAYDNIGNAVTLDVYMTKTATGPDTVGGVGVRPGRRDLGRVSRTRLRAAGDAAR